MLQKTLSLGSIGGIVAILIGTALAVFALTQFQFGRTLTGIPGQGKLSING